jgi:hypothetical protein
MRRQTQSVRFVQVLDPSHSLDGMSTSSAAKRPRTAATTVTPGTLQMEAVVQTLSQPEVAEELARRIRPASGPEHAPFREAVRSAGLVLILEKDFKKIDAQWARCLDSASRGDDYKTARQKLHTAYATIGQVANGGVDRRAFENEVAVNYGYSNRGEQDEKLRPRNSHYGLHRDTMRRVFYEGSVKAIAEGAKKAKEQYNRVEAQVQAMPEAFLLAIDWADEGADSEEEGEEAE